MPDQIVKLAGKDFRIPDAFKDAIATSHNTTSDMTSPPKPNLAYGKDGISSAGYFLDDAARYGVEVLTAKEKAVGLTDQDQSDREILKQASVSANQIQMLGKWLYAQYREPQPYHIPVLSVGEETVVRGVMDDLPGTLRKAIELKRKTYDLLESNPTLKIAVYAQSYNHPDLKSGEFTIPPELSTKAGNRPGLDQYNLARFHADVHKHQHHVPYLYNLEKLAENLERIPGAIPQPEKGK